MKQDEVKREEAYDVVQDCALKVETIEGGTVYMLTTINSHPTHQKTLFSMGNIQIFMEVVVTCYYVGQSKPQSLPRGDPQYLLPQQRDRLGLALLR